MVSNQDDDAGTYIIPVDAQLCKREGKFRPIFIECQNRIEEINIIVNQIKDLLQNQTWQGCKIPQIEANNIGILYRHCREKDKLFISELLKQLHNFTQAIWLNEYSDARKQVNDLGVKIQTIHSAKGLQYAVVFVLWADLFPAPFLDTNEEQERNLFYVALTRPEEYLMITSSRKSSFTQIISNYLHSDQPSLSNISVFEDIEEEIPF